MLFVPLLLLERAPDPASAGGGGMVASVIAPAELDAAVGDRGPAPPVEPAVEAAAGTAGGQEGMTPVGADDPAADSAAPPPPTTTSTSTTTTSAPVVATTTTTSTTVVPSAKALLPARGRQQTGQASWYHAADASCAHLTLPWGTIVTVIRVSTGAKATCRVSDRGPADTSRVIDLSYDTFTLLAHPGTGLIEVRLQW